MSKDDTDKEREVHDAIVNASRTGGSDAAIAMLLESATSEPSKATHSGTDVVDVAVKRRSRRYCAGCRSRRARQRSR